MERAKASGYFCEIRNANPETNAGKNRAGTSGLVAPTEPVSSIRQIF